MRHTDWKQLTAHCAAGTFSFVDLFFAQRVLRQLASQEEAHAAFLAALFASFRLGHLNLDLSQDPLPLSSCAQLTALIRQGAETLPPNAWVIRSGSHYYLPACWHYEREVITHLERLSRAPLRLEIPLPSADPSLNPQQQTAIAQALQHPVSFLTGGPGTGKTFTAARLVTTCLAAVSHPESFRILLMAPTGKAAFQLESNLKKMILETAVEFDSELVPTEGHIPQVVKGPSVGNDSGSKSSPTAVSRMIATPLSMRVGTLHALLQVRSQGQEPPVALYADLIVVDESSMIDARLFARLVASVQEGTRLVFIGDKDQLPPVELGSVFADLLESGRYPATTLQQCLRSDSALILSLAQAIKEGQAEQVFSLLEGQTAWIGLEESSPSLVLEQLWLRFGRRCTLFFSEEPAPSSLLDVLGHFTLLSCIRQGPLGVDAVNRYFLEQVLAQAGSASWMAIPVMITTNQHELALYNGDQGVLCCRTSSDPVRKQFAQEDYLVFADQKGGVRTVSPWALSSFSLSYCLSVHKSQGSEYAEVLVLAPPGSESFGREVLYTAVTRAKKGVMVASTRELITTALSTCSRKCSGIG